MDKSESGSIVLETNKGGKSIDCQFRFRKDSYELVLDDTSRH